jgi:dolichol-phosphate mannosyltransferase
MTMARAKDHSSEVQPQACAGLSATGGGVALGEIHLAIVTPMANEEDTVVKLVSQVLHKCGALGCVSYFVVLDNVSTDGTRRVLEELAQREPRLHVVWAPENRCVVDAYLRGYQEALRSQADWVLEIDGGFSHLPEDIVQFFGPMLDGCEAVFGSRFMPGGRITSSSRFRRWVSLGGSRLANLLLGTSLFDMTSGFEMFRRGTLERVLALNINSRAHFFQTEIKVYCRNLNIREVPIRYSAASPRLTYAGLLDALNNLGELFWKRLTRRLPSA